MMGLHLLQMNSSDPIATLPSKDAARASTPNANGDSLSVESPTALPVASKTGELNMVARQLEQIDLAKTDQNEQLGPRARVTAARDIALMELTSQALKVRPLGRQIGIKL